MYVSVCINQRPGYNLEGVGIDDIHIFDKALIHSGGTVTGITQPVSGSNWIHFNSGATRVASLNDKRNTRQYGCWCLPVTGPGPGAE
ncbi:MAG: hypothetical protein IPL84_18100 [Chitinophagaceae bacterium]|nr:hypothetical protein [Chitinophagaceae bacterium]